MVVLKLALFPNRNEGISHAEQQRRREENNMSHTEHPEDAEENIIKFRKGIRKLV